MECLDKIKQVCAAMRYLEAHPNPGSKSRSYRSYLENCRRYDQKFNNKVVKHHILTKKNPIVHADMTNSRLQKRKYPKPMRVILFGKKKERKNGRR